uniref:Phospholipase A2 domain-containing protein n=1 Tax=Romanomermis culicivorax TaxID=13658 RepID=A0A915HK30_ROMCU
MFCTGNVYSLGRVIDCTHDHKFPLIISFIKFNGYGCYCGIGGRGTPSLVNCKNTPGSNHVSTHIYPSPFAIKKLGIFLQCCQTHDNCYDKCHDKRGLFGLRCYSHIAFYSVILLESPSIALLIWTTSTLLEILKFFNFEELCIAERINPNFKCCVESELYRLKYVDFDRIFTDSWMKVMEKIQRYCSSLRRLKNLNNVMSFLLGKEMESCSLDEFAIEDFMENLFILLPSLQKLTCLEIDSNFGWENALSFVENCHNLRQLNCDRR